MLGIEKAATHIPPKIARILPLMRSSELATENKLTALQQARAEEVQFQQVAYDITDHGKTHDQARNHPLLADHARPHFDRQALWADFIYNDDPHLHIVDTAILRGHTLFARGHDADQLNVAHRNLAIERPEDRLNPRSGRHHQLAGALQLLAQRELYQNANGLTSEEARRAVAFGALEILFHDSLDILKVSIPQTRVAKGIKPYKQMQVFDTQSQSFVTKREMLHGEELIQLVTPSDGHMKGFDLLSLSPAQIVELTIHFKALEDNASRANGYNSPHRFVDREMTPHGLDPQFEAEFADALRELEQDDTPLFLDVSASQRKQFVTALEIDVAGDQLDALFPRVGILRTLANDHARKRELYTDATATYLPYSSEGSFYGDTDLARKEREVLILADLVEGTELAKTHFGRDILPGMLVDYSDTLENDGEILMSGDREAITQLVQDIWTEEIFFTAQAFAHREGLNTDDFLPDLQTITNHPYDYEIENRLYKIQAIIAYLQHTHHTDVAHELQALLDNLPTRVGDTMDAIMDPRKYQRKNLGAIATEEGTITEKDLAHADHVLVTFSPQRVRDFQSSCQEIIYGPQTHQRRREFKKYNTFVATMPDGKRLTFQPRYLAGYKFARRYFLHKSKPTPIRIRPYDNYIRPQGLGEVRNRREVAA